MKLPPIAACAQMDVIKKNKRKPTLRVKIARMRLSSRSKFSMTIKKMKKNTISGLKREEIDSNTKAAAKPLLDRFSDMIKKPKQKKSSAKFMSFGYSIVANGS